MYIHIHSKNWLEACESRNHAHCRVPVSQRGVEEHLYISV